MARWKPLNVAGLPLDRQQSMLAVVEEMTGEVARLEAANAALLTVNREADRKLGWLWADNHRAKAANERLAAALADAATAIHADRHHDGRFRDCEQWGCSSARAALSDQGEGLEVRKQAVKEIGLADAEIENHFNHRRGPNQLRAAQRHLRAALHRLGGT